jgi:hypothetical protein
MKVLALTERDNAKRDLDITKERGGGKTGASAKMGQSTFLTLEYED